MDCNGPLQILVLPISFFKRLKYNADASIAANYPKCKTCFISKHLLQWIAAKLAISEGIRLEHVQLIKIENLINTPNPLPFPDATSHTITTSSVILTLTLLRLQCHSWVHAKSCFKKSAYIPSETIFYFAFPSLLIQ
jgi:hypothetical protein